MGDWAPGDLALCIRNGPIPHKTGHTRPAATILVIGRVYVVLGIGEASPNHIDAGEIGLFIDTSPRPYSTDRFIKVTPPEEMEGDELEALILSAAPLSPEHAGVVPNSVGIRGRNTSGMEARVPAPRFVALDGAA